MVARPQPPLVVQLTTCQKQMPTSESLVALCTDGGVGRFGLSGIN